MVELMPTDGAELAFGVETVIDLLGSQVTGGDWSVFATTVDAGRVEPDTIEIPSRILDGSLGYVDSYGNRIITLSLGILGNDAEVRARGEAALMRECVRAGRNQLRVRIPFLGSQPAVFDVIGAVMDVDMDIDAERAGLRRVALTLTVLPFPRSAESVTIPVLDPAGGTESATTLLDGTSLTGWTAGSTLYSSGGVTAVQPPYTTSSSIRGFGWSAYGDGTWAPTTPQAIDMTSKPYLTLRVQASSSVSVTVKTNGSIVTGLAPVATVASGGYWKVYVYRLPAGTTTLNSINVQGGWSMTSPYPLLVDYVTLTNVRPGDGQLQKTSVRNLEVYGSARTEVSLHVAAHDGVTPLGITLLYSDPALADGYVPSLRKWKTSTTTTTADSAALSGSSNSVGSGSVFSGEIPAALMRGGTYVAYGSAKNIAVGTVITVTCSTKVGGISYATQTRKTTVSAAMVSSYRVASWGAFRLPTVPVAEGSSAVVAVSVSATVPAGGSAFALDDLLLMRSGRDTSVEIVDCGSAFSHLWIYPPSIDRLRPEIHYGTAADGSDRIHVPSSAISAWEMPHFTPGMNSLYVASFGAASADVDGYYPPRWHTHPAALPAA